MYHYIERIAYYSHTIQFFENMAIETNIGETVKKYRTKLGLSQEEFAKKSGVKYTTLTNIESSVIKKAFGACYGENFQST